MPLNKKNPQLFNPSGVYSWYNKGDSKILPCEVCWKSPVKGASTSLEEGNIMQRIGSHSQPKRRCGFMIASMVLVVLMLCGGVFAGNLRLSEAKDIAHLTLTKTYIEKSPVSSMKPNARMNFSESSQGVYSKPLTYSIDVKDCTLIRTTDGDDCLFIDGLRSLTKPGRPQLPMVTLTAKLDKNAAVLGIEVVSGSYHEILNPVSFTSTHEPRLWMRSQDVPEQTRKRLEWMAAAQPIDDYFPGDMVVYHAGRDNAYVYVHVKAYPVQYAPKSNEAVLITNARINVYYTVPASRTEEPEDRNPVDTAECVILCPAELKLAAERLRDFHIDRENVSTSVITMEDISASYLPAADPPFLGYSGTYAGKDKIVGYDYELARKIVSYLRDHEAHPNLMYVTLFGDGLLVPPSYYINEMARYEWYDSEYYYDWIPTDFLYSSPDYDYIANYRVGRLPVSDADQAVSVVDKIERWHDGLSWDWFKRASVAGGRPFGTALYYGELSTVDAINKDIFNGMELAKYYYTDGTFDVNHVTPLLTTEDTGFFYHVDHGSGHVLWVGENSISASDVMIPETPRTPILNPEAPIVVSVSCISGAYDTDMTAFEYQPEFDAIPYPTSFGEATVLSNAGGIAYVGGSRLNYAGWSTFYDEGRLLMHHYYMTQICNSVFESYHEGARRIGDMTYAALRRYAQDTVINYSMDRETLFGFVLLGDPVLSVPYQRSGLSCRKPQLTAVEPDGYLNDNVPVFRNLPTDLLKTIDVVSNSDSPGVDVTSIYTWRDVIVKKDSLNGPSVTHTFTPTDCGYHLVRAVAADGKEGWLYVNTQFVFVPSSDVLLLDGDSGADYDTYYTDAIGNIGRTCDIWEIGAREVVGAEILGQYDIVILGKECLWGVSRQRGKTLYYGPEYRVVYDQLWKSVRPFLSELPPCRMDGLGV
jgi:hypothetical protein